ncbi:MAG: hypothetical protein H0X51_00355 [Parachlamydiaceae bacterium]|nr:hypothetical protein [Parachlamydiaceae bacterium]
MISNDKLFCMSVQAVPAFFAYREIVLAGSAALLNPIGGAVCTALASYALAKLGEYLGTTYAPLHSIKKSHKVYIIPSIWVISAALTTMTQFPLRLITAISPLVTSMGAVALVSLMALGILYYVAKSPSNTQQTIIPPQVQVQQQIPLVQQQLIVQQQISTLDPSEVVSVANRVLGDIGELNKTRGITKFSYTFPKDVDRPSYRAHQTTERMETDKDAAIAVLHQKIAKHLEGMGVTIPSPKRENLGFKTFGDPTRTFFTFSQELLDSKTKKIIARTTFDINHTDKTKISIFSSDAKGKLESEIVMKPFQVVI